MVLGIRKRGEEGRQFGVGVEWEHVGDVLVGPDHDERAVVAVDAAQVEDVSAPVSGQA